MTTQGGVSSRGGTHRQIRLGRHGIRHPPNPVCDPDRPRGHRHLLCPRPSGTGRSNPRGHPRRRKPRGSRTHPGGVRLRPAGSGPIPQVARTGARRRLRRVVAERSSGHRRPRSRLVQHDEAGAGCDRLRVFGRVSARGVGRLPPWKMDRPVVHGRGRRRGEHPELLAQHRVDHHLRGGAERPAGDGDRSRRITGMELGRGPHALPHPAGDRRIRHSRRHHYPDHPRLRPRNAEPGVRPGPARQGDLFETNPCPRDSERRAHRPGGDRNSVWPVARRIDSRRERLRVAGLGIPAQRIDISGGTFPCCRERSRSSRCSSFSSTSPWTSSRRGSIRESGEGERG